MALELNGTTGVSLVQDGVVTAADLAAGAITSSALPEGSVLQVVSEYFEPTSQSAYTTTTFTDTGISATITPTSTSSKILCIGDLGMILYSASAPILCFARGTSVINDGAFSAGQYGHYLYNQGASTYGPVHMTFLDTPNTTSATEYSVYIRGQTTASAITVHAGSANSITLIEIAG